MICAADGCANDAGHRRTLYPADEQIRVALVSVADPATTPEDWDMCEAHARQVDASDPCVHCRARGRDTGIACDRCARQIGCGA